MFKSWILSLCFIFCSETFFSQEYIKTEVGSGFNGAFSFYVDSSGMIYVADYLNNQIKKMEGNGTNIQVIGFNFQKPGGITMNTEGKLFISERSANKIKTIDTSGNNNVTVISSGINSPMGLVFDSQGKLLVADNGNSAVRRINLQTGSNTVVATGFFDITSIALDSAGNIYVADSTSKITRIKTNGTKENLGTGLYKITAVTVDQQDNIYVAEFIRPEKSIIKMDSNGQNQQIIATDIYYPIGIFTDNSGNVFVSQNGTNSPLIKLSPVNLATENVKQKTIKLYPIPAKDQLFLSEEVLKIKVYSENGSLILSKSKASVINISKLTKGVYFIVGEDLTGKIKINEKFIKK